MYPNELTIDGVTYRFRRWFLSDKQLWHCCYISSDSAILERDGWRMSRIGKDGGKVYSELSRDVKRIFRHDILCATCPGWTALSNDEQRRIIDEGDRCKRVIESEWRWEDGDYKTWCRMMEKTTTLHFTEEQYYYLFL